MGLLMSGKPSRAVVIAVAVLAATRAGAAETPRIGVAAVAVNAVEVVGGGQTRAIKTGAPVFQMDTVQTGADSRAQMIFLDETTLSLGPKSKMVLDAMVFDPANPASTQGGMAVKAVEGAFRFVTGSQDPKAYVITTPTTTIGIRGTIVDIVVQTNGATEVLLRQGQCSVTPTGSSNTQQLSTPGQATTVTPGATVPTPPSAPSSAMVSAVSSITVASTPTPSLTVSAPTGVAGTAASPVSPTIAAEAADTTGQPGASGTHRHCHYHDCY